MELCKDGNLAIWLVGDLNGNLLVQKPEIQAGLESG